MATLEENVLTAGASQSHLTRIAWLVAAATAIRLIGIASFPEIHADEGLWTNSSKNFVLFGDWFMDGRTHFLLSPVFHLISAALFSLARPSIALARTISAVAGGLSVGLVYALTLRLSRERDTAFLTALLFGFSGFAALQSRTVLIEPLQLFFVLLSALLLTFGGRWAFVSAAVAFALALLSKINAIFLVLVFALFLFWGCASDNRRFRLGDGIRTALFVTLSVGVAAVAYGWLYAQYPTEFTSAFRFELVGAHFEALSRPMIRLGRFGLDPIQASRTILALFSGLPFLMVLMCVGGAIALVTRPASSFFYGSWLIVGSAYFLLQIYQPLRYFYLLTPALSYFAALTLNWLAVAVPPDSKDAAKRVKLATIGVFLAFNLAYLGMGAIANPAVKLRQVLDWAETHTQPDDRIIAAGYFCTDLPHRAYAHYHLARTPEQLLAAIERYGIDYVIYDDAEWQGYPAETLATHFERVQTWAFGAAYRVRDVTVARKHEN